MKVYFLGTGTSQGIPVIGSTHPVCLSDNTKDKRLRASVWIHWEGYDFVIDCTPDFRQQMLQSGCTKIDALLFTHEHSDHTAGLDDIRPFYFAQGDIPVYGHKRVLANLSRRFDYIFETENKYPGAPSVGVYEVKCNQNITIGTKVIVPIDALHADLQVFGYRFGKFAYLTDVKTIAIDQIEKLKHLDVLVINALRLEPHHSHFNLEEALAFVNQVSPKRAYFTHISHHFGFHEAIEQMLPVNVFVAYDNLVVDIT